LIDYAKKWGGRCTVGTQVTDKQVIFKLPSHLVEVFSLVAFSRKQERRRMTLLPSKCTIWQ